MQVNSVHKTEMPERAEVNASTSSADIAKARRSIYSIGLFALLCIACYGFYDAYVWSALAHSGRTTQAQVLSKEETHSKSTSYHVHYTFTTTTGQTQTGSDTVASGVYQGTAEGGPVQITYLPANPRLSRIGAATQDRASNSRDFAVGALMLCFVAVGIIVVFCEFSFWREARKRR